eukprot:338448_1
MRTLDGLNSRLRLLGALNHNLGRRAALCGNLVGLGALGALGALAALGALCALAGTSSGGGNSCGCISGGKLKPYSTLATPYPTPPTPYPSQTADGVNWPATPCPTPATLYPTPTPSNTSDKRDIISDDDDGDNRIRKKKK